MQLNFANFTLTHFKEIAPRDEYFFEGPWYLIFVTLLLKNPK